MDKDKKPVILVAVIGLTGTILAALVNGYFQLKVKQTPESSTSEPSKVTETSTPPIVPSVTTVNNNTTSSILPPPMSDNLYPLPITPSDSTTSGMNPNGATKRISDQDLIARLEEAAHDKKKLEALSADSEEMVTWLARHPEKQGQLAETEERLRIEHSKEGRLLRKYRNDRGIDFLRLYFACYRLGYKSQP